MSKVFWGRSHELMFLDKKHESNKNTLGVIYGRRRVGKSHLIKKFKSNKKNVVVIEALELASLQEQINHFISELSKTSRDINIKKIEFKTWKDVFSYLTSSYFNKDKKIILIIDEFQWLASKKSSVVSLLKYFWDNEWADFKVDIILCGSIAQFMVNSVIKSKALYGRIDYELKVHPMHPAEISLFLKNKKSIPELLQYQLILGQIPKYYTYIDISQSLEKNINQLCFQNGGALVTEYEKIFYAQFKEAKTYQKIAELLSVRPRSLNDISKSLKMASGGGLASYLVNLELADFIKSEVSFFSKQNSKTKKYRLSDPFLIFYFKYMHKNIQQIKKNSDKNLFALYAKSEWNSWLGIAFENFCKNNSVLISEKLKFSDQVLKSGSYFEKNDNLKQGLQIDLVYERADKTYVLTEVKNYSKKIGTEIIKEMNVKIERFPGDKRKSIEKLLIAANGVEKSLIDTEYFDHILTAKDLVK